MSAVTPDQGELNRLQAIAEGLLRRCSAARKSSRGKPASVRVTLTACR
jgi:hypothetical protein